MSHGPSEPESAEPEGDEGQPVEGSLQPEPGRFPRRVPARGRPGRRESRRQLIARLARMGLGALVVGGVNLGRVREARAEECGSIPGDWVIEDANCDPPNSGTDASCGKQNKDGSVDPDGHCGKGEYPANFDASCGTKSEAGAGGEWNEDSNCGGPADQGTMDPDSACGQQNSNGSHVADEDCGNQDANGDRSSDDSCNKATGAGGTREDNDCGTTSSSGAASQDGHCGQTNDDMSTSADDDCGQSTGGAGGETHQDSNCGGTDKAGQFDIDDDCGKSAGGGVFHQDNDCGKSQVPGGVPEEDQDCGKPKAGGGNHGDG